MNSKKYAGSNKNIKNKRTGSISKEAVKKRSYSLRGIEVGFEL